MFFLDLRRVRNEFDKGFLFFRKKSLEIIDSNELGKIIKRNEKNAKIIASKYTKGWSRGFDLGNTSFSE